MKKLNTIKYLLLVIFFVFPLWVSAKTFDKNLYFGIINDPDVQMLQEFLTDQGAYSGPITGNFFSLTLAAVKKYQTQNDITPAAGFFGPITRVKANDILSTQTQSSDAQAMAETGTTTSPVTQNSTTDSSQQLILTLQTQILALQQQLVQMQQQNQTIQNQQTQIQTQQTQIQQNQQNQISSIQQQTNQQTPTNQQTSTQTSTQTQNQAIQQPILLSSLQLALRNDVLTNSLRSNYVEILIEQNPQNLTSKNPKWEIFLNNQPMNLIPFTNANSGWASFHLPNLISETTYTYKVVYKEDGRQDSIITGTFRTPAIDPTTQIPFDQNKLSITIPGAESTGSVMRINYDRKSPLNNTNYKMVIHISGGPVDIRTSPEDSKENIVQEGNNLLLQPLTPNTIYEYKLNITATDIDGRTINLEKPFSFRTPSGNLGDYSWYPYSGSNLSYANVSTGSIVCFTRTGKSFKTTSWPWPDFKIMSSMTDSCP